MHRHQRPGDRQTNAETGFRAIVCTGRLREDFEKRGSGIRFKTHAIVLDRHRDGRAIAFDVQPDMATIDGVLYGFVKQVGHHLRDPCEVAAEKESARLLVDYRAHDWQQQGTGHPFRHSQRDVRAVREVAQPAPALLPSVSRQKVARLCAIEGP
jgi:hypothetical protein